MIASSALERARSIPIEDEVSRRGVKLRGTVERAGPCPRCGGRDRFGVNVRKQVFNCRQCGAKGNVISLVKWLDDCTFAEAIETLAGESTERPQIKPQERVADPDKYERQQAAKARWLWRQRCPIAGSPAERYLRERRYAGPPPATLAYLPARGEHLHAMIAAFALCDEPEPGIVGEPRAVNAVHLTLLKPDGSGKADTKPNKLIVGRPLSRPIVLAPPNDLLGLVITEGIEDALSMHEATGLGAWAAGSASFIPALADAVPPYVECLTVCVDDDPTGRKHASELVRRLRDRGFEVIPRLLRSPEAAA